MAMIDCDDWNIRGGARIIGLEQLASYRDNLNGRIVMTSAPCDPIHSGHQSSFVDCATLPFINQTAYDRNIVVVVVNGDRFLINKKGHAFMPLRARCEVISFCRGVDFVVPFDASWEGDQTVCEAIRILRPHIFGKGGDRIDAKTIPEWEICNSLGIQIITGLGSPKQWSSSDFLGEYKRWYVTNVLKTTRSN